MTDVRGKPWLKKGLTLDQRIEEGLPEAMKIIRPEEYAGYLINQTYKHRWQHVEACRGMVVVAIRVIASGVELDLATPLEEKRAILLAAKKMREAREALARVPWSRSRRRAGSALVHEQSHAAAMVKALAGKIPNKRSGGSPRARINKVRKQMALRHADDLLCDFGSRGPPRATSVESGGTFAQLAQVLYEAATGEVGSLRRILLEYVKEHWSWIRSRGDRRKQKFNDDMSAELVALIESDAWVRDQTKQWLLAQKKTAQRH